MAGRGNQRVWSVARTLHRCRHFLFLRGRKVYPAAMPLSDYGNELLP
jgi:hypothetical protein